MHLCFVCVTSLFSQKDKANFDLWLEACGVSDTGLVYVVYADQDFINYTEINGRVVLSRIR